jgi:hypothetical protein
VNEVVETIEKESGNVDVKYATPSATFGSKTNP